MGLHFKQKMSFKETSVSSCAHRICGIKVDFLFHGIGVLTRKEEAFTFSSNDPVGTDIIGVTRVSLLWFFTWLLLETQYGLRNPFFYIDIFNECHHVYIST